MKREEEVESDEEEIPIVNRATSRTTPLTCRKIIQQCISCYEMKKIYLPDLQNTEVTLVVTGNMNVNVLRI